MYLMSVLLQEALHMVDELLFTLCVCFVGIVTKSVCTHIADGTNHPVCQFNPLVLIYICLHL